jgi:outer membrane lipoprotein-sorting protein
MSSIFENRVVCLLLVIVALLLISLWGAYNAFLKLEKKVDKISDVSERAQNTISDLAAAHQKDIPGYIDQIKSYGTELLQALKRQ